MCLCHVGDKSPPTPTLRIFLREWGEGLQRRPFLLPSVQIPSFPPEGPVDRRRDGGKCPAPHAAEMRHRRLTLWRGRPSCGVCRTAKSASSGHEHRRRESLSQGRSFRPWLGHGGQRVCPSRSPASVSIQCPNYKNASYCSTGSLPALPLLPYRGDFMLAK